MKTLDPGHPKVHLTQFVRLFCVLLPLLLITGSAVQAATRTWDGSANNLWSVPDNWSGNIKPADGDDLVFPAGAGNKHNINDYVNLHVNSITFTDSGYNLDGNPTTVTNAVRAEQPSGANTISFDLYLEKPNGLATFTCPNAGASLGLSGILLLALGDGMLTVSNAGDVTFQGQVSGGGGIIKQGSGTLTYLGNIDNIYHGPTEVRGGLLVLGKTGGAESLAYSDLTITNATVREAGAHQIAGVPITINKGGLLDLNGFDDEIGPSLTLNKGGDVQTGAGTLTLPAETTVTVNPGPSSGESSTISGNLRTYGPCTFDVAPVISIWGNGLSISATVSSASTLRKTGNGILYLSASNSFTGAFNVEAGTLAISHSLALGGTSAGTTVSNNAALRISDNINVSGEALTLASKDPNGAVECTGGTNTWSGPITLAEDAVMNISTNARLTLSGAIGSRGGLTKTGPGTLTLSGATGNPYTGKTTVEQGVLELAKSAGNAISGAGLIIGDGAGGEYADVVRLKASNQILDSVPLTIGCSGLLDLNGYDETVGALNLDGGDVTTGAGLLTPKGNVTVVPNTNSMSAISGRVQLLATRTIDVTGHYWSPDLSLLATISGSGSLVKSGPGEIRLSGSNSFSGTVTVNDGYLTVTHDWALGSTNAGTAVVSNAVLLVLDNTHVGLEPLSLNGNGASGWGALSGSGSNSWAGDVTLAGNSTICAYIGANLNLSGRVGGAGDLIKTGTGTLQFSGGTANSYGSTFVNAGTLELAKSTPNAAIPGTLVIGDGMGGANADVVRVIGSEQIHDLAAVTINSSGMLDVSSLSAGEIIGSLTGSGHVELGSQTLDTGNNNTSTTFSGLISGAGGTFQKRGSGTMTLTGNNTYTGATVVLHGTLLVNGSQPASLAGTLPGATLGGTGTVGDIIAYGIISPGTSPGILTCSNVAMNAGSTFRVELNGTLPGVGYDRLNVRGTNNLGGATLEVALGFTPALDEAFAILDNDGSDKIVGTFAGLTNGATLSAGLAEFRINYDGGTGNDVVLTTTHVYPALVITSVTRVGTNLDLQWSGGRPDYVVEKATALATNPTWQAVTPPTSETRATVPMDATNGFYRIRGGN